MQTMTKTLQKLIGKPLVESTDQEIYLALLDLEVYKRQPPRHGKVGFCEGARGSGPSFEASQH